MRTLKKNLGYAICMLLCALLFTSCFPDKEPIDNYKGGIIYGKKSNMAGNMRLVVRNDSTFVNVMVYKLDFEKYVVGDTIK